MEAVSSPLTHRPLDLLCHRGSTSARCTIRQTATPSGLRAAPTRLQVGCKQA